MIRIIKVKYLGATGKKAPRLKATELRTGRSLISPIADGPDDPFHGAAKKLVASLRNDDMSFGDYVGKSEDVTPAGGYLFVYNASAARLDSSPGMRVPTDSGARLGDGAPPSPTPLARPLTRDEVTFTVTTEAEDLGGSELENPEDTAAIQARLDSGDSDAWCGVIVTASYRGFTGLDSIWGCSLDSTYTAAVVAEDHGMYDEALQALNESIAVTLANLAPIILR